MTRHPADTAPADAHDYTLRVYYEDTDAGGIVYHASYLRFAERARTEALRAMGVPHGELVEQHGLIFVVRRIELRYLRPARLDELITVRTEILSLRRATTTLRQGFRADSGDLAMLEVELACVRGDGRPARIPERWHAALAGVAQGSDRGGGRGGDQGNEGA